MSRSISIIATCLMLICGCARTPTNNGSAEGNARPARSTGQDTYSRLLEVQVSDLAPMYEVGQPIPVTVQITNLGPHDSRDADVPSKPPTAQLFPHLTVWVGQYADLPSERIELPIENRIWIKQGETFKRSVDLSELKLLSSPGKYFVHVGHENHMVTDLGDWTGTLRSRGQVIEIRKKE